MSAEGRSSATPALLAPLQVPQGAVGGASMRRGLERSLARVVQGEVHLRSDVAVNAEI